MHRPLGITVSRHIMDLQRMHPEATGDLSGLLNELIVAAKTISAEVNMAGLADVLGMSGKINIQGEEVQKLDEFTNNTIKRRMARCGYLCVMTSEEEEDIIPVSEGYEGKYTLAFDPLDGSSNIDVNVSIGTIFSKDFGTLRSRAPTGSTDRSSRTSPVVGSTAPPACWTASGIAACTGPTARSWGSTSSYAAPRVTRCRPSPPRLGKAG